MDLKLVKKGLDYAWKGKKWLLLLAACSFNGYGLYRVYNLPAITRKRKSVLKLLGALIFITEAISDTAETIGVVSKDLKDFLHSDSDQIPNSLKQISKIMNSNEFSESVVKVTQALTVGILQGSQFQAKSKDSVNNTSIFGNKIFDKIFTTAGTGFASVVVGSFARNLVMAFYSQEQSYQEFHSNSSSDENSIPRWMNVVCSDEKCRELIGNCIQLFVSTAVAVYLDKTMNINSYGEFFAGLTNPKHEAKVRDVLLAVCSSAVESLVKTSHQVLTSSNSSSPYMAVDQGPRARRKRFSGQEALSMQFRVRNSFHEVKHCGWIGKVSSTLAVPNNRQFVLDVTGRVTFEMVRSFLEILMEKLLNGMKRSADVVHETVVKYITAKSSVVFAICLSLCLHILDAPWILEPA